MDQPILSDELRAEIRELIGRYPEGRGRSAILPALYAIQREHGHASVAAQNELAAILGLEPSEVGAVVSFYHMIHQEPKGDYLLQVCTNVPCMLRGASACMHHLEETLGVGHGETTDDGVFTLEHMECLGSCATAPMVAATRKASGEIRYFEELETAEDIDAVLGMLRKDEGFDTLERWTPGRDSERTGRGAGPYTVAGMENPYLTRRVGRPDSHTIEAYEADAVEAGYATARRIIASGSPTPDELVEQVKASGLKGRGGAGFPTGVKWGFLAPNAFPRYLVVNADESEPGTFKDRCIMEYDPHQLIESIIITAYAVQAEHAYIYIRGEYYFAWQRLEAAIAEARAKGYLGEGLFGTDFDLDIDVFEGQRQRAERFTRRLDAKRPLDGAGVEARKSDQGGFRRVRRVQRVRRWRGAPRTHALPMRSTCPKKKPSSSLAFSSESEPWIALRSLLSAYSARTVPGAASAGSVAPMTSRR
jgi:NADH-quinone oxidoreductase E subunit